MYLQGWISRSLYIDNVSRKISHFFFWEADIRKSLKRTGWRLNQSILIETFNSTFVYFVDFINVTIFLTLFVCTRVNETIFEREECTRYSWMRGFCGLRKMACHFRGWHMCRSLSPILRHASNDRCKEFSSLQKSAAFVAIWENWEWRSSQTAYAHAHTRIYYIYSAIDLCFVYIVPHTATYYRARLCLFSWR